MLKEFQVDNLKIKVLKNRYQMGVTAALLIEEEIKKQLKVRRELNIIFASAPSQNEMFDTLIKIEGIEWERINAFHMDEYIGLKKEAPQNFGNFLKEKIFSKLPLKSVWYLNGQAKDVIFECNRYSSLIKKYPPDIVCMGVGENGHIAFNDPPVADFNDEKIVKIVDLDEICRQQQVNDGCFEIIEKVPKQAMTLTIPALLSAKSIFCVVPGITKREAIYNMLREEIDTKCPASILRSHKSAILFCDLDSGQDVLFRKAIITDEASQDFEEAARLAKENGCEAVEVRTVWDKTPHELNDEDIDKIINIANENNLKICAVSSSVFKCSINDPIEIQEHYKIFEKCLNLAHRTSAKYLRVFTFWREKDISKTINFIAIKLQKLAKKAAEYNITLVVEVEPSVNISNSEEMVLLFDKLNMENIKVLWDPGNLIYNPEFKIPYPNGYELVKEKIAHIHLKDAIRDKKGETNGILLGDGLLDITGQLKRLLNDGYDGYLSLEPHFRSETVLSEDELKLPGGITFSEGGFEATELSLKRFDELIFKILS